MPDAADTTSALGEPTAVPPPPQARTRTKGVADIVFMVDVSGSMAPIIDALRAR